MNQYHQRENPPSYESVIQQDNQNKSQSTGESKNTSHSMSHINNETKYFLISCSL